MVPLKDFYIDQSHLPSFNSHSLEANIHHVPGLSAKFLYLCDDFFFGKPSTPSDFITKDLRHVVYTVWDKPMPSSKATGRIGAVHYHAGNFSLIASNITKGRS
jgi:hypothetical protein